MVNESLGFRFVLTAGFFVILIAAFPLVYAQVTQATTVTVTPSSLTVPQGSPATYLVSLTQGCSGLYCARPQGEAYSLSVNGLPSDYQGAFASNPVTTSNGAASTSLSLDTSEPQILGGALYCPNTYPFTVVASGSAGDTATSEPASLTVTQVGPSLQVSVTSDAPSYISGKTITITVTANRPAEGTLTVNPPSGAPMTYSFSFTLGEAYTATETLTAGQPYGTWTMSVQADDYCGVTSSSTGQFSVGPNTYDVHVSLSGIPATFAVGLQVDGASQGRIGGAQNKTLSFPIGTQHTISVDRYVNGTENGSRYYAAQNDWTVNAAGSHVFQYQPEYLLTERVGVKYGNATFYGPPCCGNTTVNWSSFTTTGGYPLQTRIWYPAGTVVTLGQPSELVGNIHQYPNGTLFMLLGQDVDCSNCVTQASNGAAMVTMNGPHTSTTTYVLQYRLWVISYYGNPQLVGVSMSGGLPNEGMYIGNGNPTILTAYYTAGTIAKVSVNSPTGYVIQHVFTYWSTLGGNGSTSPTTDVVMNRPMILTAEWGTSYTLLYYEITGAITGVAVIAVAAKYAGLGLRGPPSGGPGPVEEPVEEF